MYSVRSVLDVDVAMLFIFFLQDSAEDSEEMAEDSSSSAG
jgi:hypothetical protein